MQQQNEKFGRSRTAGKRAVERVSNLGTDVSHEELEVEDATSRTTGTDSKY